MTSGLPQIDRYRLLEVIGTGGFSTVYRGVDERFDANVAVKVLAENHALNPEIRERFITEVQLLRRLAGVPTVAVYDLGETETGQPFAVMALADGNLAQRAAILRSNSITIGPAEVNRLVDELTRCLSPLHAKGIVHRDVKPLNLLVFGSTRLGGDPASEVTTLAPSVPKPDAGRPRELSRANRTSTAFADNLLANSESLRLADLGFAKDLAQQSCLTAAGGTPGFMPPEQCRPGIIDARADVYAATAVVAWLITGQTPGSLAPEDVCRRAADLLGPSASPDGLMSGLADEPGNRPTTIDDWWELMTSTLITPRVSRTFPDRRTTGRTTRRRAAVTAAAAGAAGLIAGVILVSMPLGGGTTRARTDTGVVVARSDGEFSVQISGPDQITVGETALFSGEAAGAAELRWIGPNGAILDGEQPLSVQGSRVGEAQVTLVATSMTGEVLDVAADFVVVPAED